MPALLAAEALSCSVAGRWLFRDLHLALEPSGLIEVRGANGSGKSTLLRGLAGLHAFQAGVVRREGALEYIGHKAGLSARLTVFENIRWQLAQRGQTTNAESIRKALIAVDLGGAEDDFCDALSAGQLRRAALVRLIVGSASVWLLDEPLTALDQDGVQLVKRLIADHRDRGGGVVCATHASVRAPCDPHPFRTLALA